MGALVLKQGTCQDLLENGAMLPSLILYIGTMLPSLILYIGTMLPSLILYIGNCYQLQKYHERAGITISNVQIRLGNIVIKSLKSKLFKKKYQPGNID